jgi:lipid-binding SYLF domain-containing protein
VATAGAVRSVLAEKTQGVWSAPVFLTLAGGSVWFQIGGRWVDVVSVMMNFRRLKKRFKSEFKFGRGASAVVGCSGMR